MAGGDARARRAQARRAGHDGPAGAPALHAGAVRAARGGGRAAGASPIPIPSPPMTSKGRVGSVEIRAVARSRARACMARFGRCQGRAGPSRRCVPCAAAVRAPVCSGAGPCGMPAVDKRLLQAMAGAATPACAGPPCCSRGEARSGQAAAALHACWRRGLPPARASRSVGWGAQVRQSAEVAHELDEWEVVHVDDEEGGAAYTRRRTVFGKISCAPANMLLAAPVARPSVRQDLVRVPRACRCSQRWPPGLVVWQVPVRPGVRCSEHRPPGLAPQQRAYGGCQSSWSSLSPVARVISLAGGAKVHVACPRPQQALAVFSMTPENAWMHQPGRPNRCSWAPCPPAGLSPAWQPRALRAAQPAPRAAAGPASLPAPAAPPCVLGSLHAAGAKPGSARLGRPCIAPAPAVPPCALAACMRRQPKLAPRAAAGPARTSASR